MLWFGLAALVLLAWANGANDVSKGVATLAGSRVASYRRAVGWGTLCTAVGAVASYWLAQTMVHRFSTGFVNGGMSVGPAFGVSIIVGATTWVLLATRFSLPVSTTHAILGAMCGVGVIALGTGQMQLAQMGSKMFSPLLLSPLVAGVVTVGVMFALPATVIAKKFCLCFEKSEVVMMTGPGMAMSLRSRPSAVATVGDCAAVHEPKLAVGIDVLHWASSGAVCFARAVNDVPKILAMGLVLCAAAQVAPISQEVLLLFLVAAMTAGSWFGGMGVLRRLGNDVTAIEPAQGFQANLATALLVLFAANWGLPVSTTHTSTGAIVTSGIMRDRRSVKWSTVRAFAGAWVITLPASALFAALAYGLVGR